ncbi:DNA glycosylase AlkZ-like family protein, partial [Ornithinimicrobium cryptoxanthini]
PVPGQDPAHLLQSHPSSHQTQTIRTQHHASRQIGVALTPEPKGPTTPQTFRWWAGISTQDARETWQLLADELVPVDLDGQAAWMLAEDEASFSAVEQPRGVRLLVASDLRLLGQDRTGRFVGPGLRPLSPLHDTFHPNGVLVDGRIVGVWGRKGGKVDVRIDAGLPRRTVEAIEAEALSLPIPGVTMSVTVTEWQA